MGKPTITMENRFFFGFLMGKPTITMENCYVLSIFHGKTNYFYGHGFNSYVVDYQRDPEGKGLFGFLDESWD